MPLHIFEPRYRRMLADVLAGDRRFGILFTPEGTGERAHEAGAVGCTAVVTEATQLEDGRSNIVVRGEDRFVLDRLVDSGKSVIVIEHHQAVMAHADWIIDLGPGAGQDGGRIVFEGTPADLVAKRSTLTGQHLAAYVGR